MKSFLRFLCLTLLGVFLQYGNIASADSNRSVGSPKEDSLRCLQRVAQCILLP